MRWRGSKRRIRSRGDADGFREGRCERCNPDAETLEHDVLNNNETNGHWLDAVIDPNAPRESDLLAFGIAIERSHADHRIGPRSGVSSRWCACKQENKR